MDATPEFAQSLRCHVAERFALLLYIAETCTLHLFDGSGESSGTYAVHIKEAEGLGKRYPFSSGLQEFDLRRHFPKHGIQTHLGQRSVRDATL